MSNHDIFSEIMNTPSPDDVPVGSDLYWQGYHDAAITAARIIAARPDPPPFTYEHVENLARWAASQGGYTDPEWLIVSEETRNRWRAWARRRLTAAFGGEGTTE